MLGFKARRGMRGARAWLERRPAGPLQARSEGGQPGLVVGSVGGGLQGTAAAPGSHTLGDSVLHLVAET